MGWRNREEAGGKAKSHSAEIQGKEKWGIGTGLSERSRMQN